MLGQLAGLLLSAKSSAIAGALILAGGAIVSTSTGAGMTGLHNERPSPTPIVEEGQVADDPLDELLEEEDPAEEPVVDPLPITEQDCQNEASAFSDSQRRIDGAFNKYNTALDKLTADLKGKGSSAVYESTSSAKALLVEIRNSAIAALDEMGLCDVLAASIGEVAFRGGAAAMVEVTQRALAAMETVYNLARSTLLKEIERLKPTPSPKPTPKKTERPEKKEAKATKAPRCDDAMYAAKKRLQKAFDQYHGGHDKLVKELKGWASGSQMEAFWANDSLLHKTYDKTREKIANAGCATGEHSSMALAETAEIIFRETYDSSKVFYSTLIVDKPDWEGCEDDMYAAKDVMYKAFERWHGANDKLIHGLKSFASDGAVDVAREADEALHEMFDRTKHQIIEADCSKDHEKKVFELANGAAEFFEVTHQNALAAVAKELEERSKE